MRPDRTARRGIRVLAALTLVPAVIAVGLIAASPASADVSTVVSFPADPTVTIDFGDAWVVPITVKNRATYTDYAVGGSQGTLQPVEENAGTVDVYLDGSPGIWASGLALQPGGVAYLAQPSQRATLGTGSHTLSAVFQPAAGSGYQTSKTTTSLTVVVKGFDAAVSTRIVDDPSAVSQPTLHVALSGSWISSHDDHAPAGTWAVTVTDLKSSKVVLRRGFVQGATNEELIIPFGYRTDPGHRYRINVVFAPAVWIAPGLSVTQAAPIGYATNDPAPLSFLVNPVGMPLWAAIAILAVIVLLLAGAVVLLAVGARTRHRIERIEAGEPVHEPVPAVPAERTPPTPPSSTGY